MGSERATHTIQELIDEGIITAHKDGNYGSMYPRQSEFGDTGVLFLTAKLVSDQGFIDFEHAPRLNNEKAEKLTFGYIESKDVLLSHNATVGRVALTPELTEPVLVGTSLTYFRTDSERLLPEYFAAYLSGVDFQNELKAVMGLSTRNQVPITAQRKLKVVIPPLPEQKAIAHILGSLDDKIELNRRMNATLEGMAQALFKSWFVDFDPVIDNALAAGNPIPDELAARAEVRRQALADGSANRDAAKPFPSAFQKTEELGWIPEGWEVTSIGDVALVVKGQSYKSSELTESKTALVTLKSFKRGGGYRLDGLKEYIGIFKPEQEVHSGDLIIAYTDVTQAADVIGKPAMVIENSKYNTLVISLDVAVVRPVTENLKYYLYGLAQTTHFQDHTASHSTGTTVLHLSKNAVPGYEFAHPTESLLQEYQSIVQPSFSEIADRTEQNNVLEKLRDTLLPKLISGELRITEAKQLTKEVLV